MLSNSVNADEIISDSDILRLKEFNKISRLSVRIYEIKQEGATLVRKVFNYWQAMAFRI